MPRVASAASPGRDERAHRQAHEIVDARADHDLFRTAPVLFGERVAQIERFGIAVPREPRQLAAHRGDRLGRRSKRALVRAEANQLALARLAHQLLGADERRRRRNRFDGAGRTNHDRVSLPRTDDTVTSVPGRPLFVALVHHDDSRRRAPSNSPKTSARGVDARGHSAIILQRTGTYQVQSARLRAGAARRA